jgi:Cd(II)/Pb(II)-responsive transcriptional regulator
VNPRLRIGDLARRAHCPRETIRYYEREGLLPEPTRSAGNYRLYGGAHLERLAFIRHCRSLDMALAEIRRLLRFRDRPLDNCEATHALLDEHIAHVAARIAELQRLERQLRTLRRQCERAREARQCGILDGLGQGLVGTSAGKKAAAHIRGSHRG